MELHSRLFEISILRRQSRSHQLVINKKGTRSSGELVAAQALKVTPCVNCPGRHLFVIARMEVLF